MTVEELRIMLTIAPDDYRVVLRNTFVVDDIWIHDVDGASVEKATKRLIIDMGEPT